jgi:hypothetical protein
MVHQLPVCADYVNILGRRIRTIKKNTQVLAVAGKENVLEVNADKTVYMVISEGDNAGRSHSIQSDNSGTVTTFGINLY